MYSIKRYDIMERLAGGFFLPCDIQSKMFLHRRRNMREIFLTKAKPLAKCLLGATLLIIVNLWAADALALLAGLAAGYGLGFAWYGVMVGRLWRSGDMSISQAKQHVVIGAILRLMLMAVVFWAAIQVSFGQFLATVAGFGIVYVLGMAVLIMSARQM